jgi:hypothetical protein
MGMNEHVKGLTACAEKTLSEGKRASRVSSCGIIFETQLVRFVVFGLRGGGIGQCLRPD